MLFVQWQANILRLIFLSVLITHLFAEWQLSEQ